MAHLCIYCFIVVAVQLLSLYNNSLQAHRLQHSCLPCPILSPWVFSGLSPMSFFLMLSNHLILCHPLLLLPSIFPSIRVFSNESTLCIRWPKYWSFSFSISPSNEYSGLTSLISLQSSGLSRFFFSTTVWKHQFFDALPSLWSNSHIHTWLLGKPYFVYVVLCRQSDVSAL